MTDNIPLKTMQPILLFRVRIYIHLLCLSGFGCGILFAEPVTNKPADTVESSVVKIFSTIQRPDIFKPWTKVSPSEVTGSGVVIGGKRILSNAHVVEYASQVEVQANGSGDRVIATVEVIAPSI